MKTLIINGSPKGNRGNTELFIRQFMLGAGQEHEVRYAAKEPPQQLAEAIGQCEALLLFMPLYVHAMPGIVMKLFEAMKPANAGQKIGVVVQAGFIEGAQARFLLRYLNAFAKRMGFENLGIVTKGDAAGTMFMPDFMNKRLFKLLQKLGAFYAEQGRFDQKTAEKLAGDYEISARQAKTYELMNRIGVSHAFWHKSWKENGVMEQGLDRPFASEKN